MFISIISTYEQPTHASHIHFLTIILLRAHLDARKCLAIKNSTLNICRPVSQKADNNICPSHRSSNMGISPLHFMSLPFFCKDYITDVMSISLCLLTDDCHARVWVYLFVLPPTFVALLVFDGGGPWPCFFPFFDVFIRRLSFFILGSTTLYGPLTPRGRREYFDAVCFLDTTYVTSFLRFPLAFLYNLKHYPKHVISYSRQIFHKTSISILKIKFHAMNSKFLLCSLLW